MELRDLQKMTVVKLREEGLKHSSIVGVHVMDKAQLVAALADVYGIDVEAATKAAREQAATDKSALKQAIRALKGQRDAALATHDATQVKQLRLNMKKRKRMLRRLATSQPATR